MREDLIRQIEAYQPFNEQEARDKETILQMLRTVDNIFLRDNLLAHMTASAWVTDPARARILMAYHNLYNSWAWLGGHADGSEDLLQVAVREVREESGIDRVRPVTEEIFSLEVLTVDGHEKRGVYVPSHLHLNVTYLLEADSRQQVRMKADENSAVGWFSLDEAVERSTEPWFKTRIYRKLNQKLAGMA
ncbi:MAG: NUDIX hydrolase [Lachnospiraceae bacterium]|nr:NUDIX hydrolase [Lachnospiraceae bacterium]